MKITNYSCDICEEPKNAGEVAGFSINSITGAFMPQGSEDAKLHICIPCLRGIVAIASKVTATKHLVTSEGAL